MKLADKKWYQALALACATLWRLHEEDLYVREMYRELGLTKKLMIDAEVEQTDIDAIADAFNCYSYGVWEGMP